MKKAVSEVLWLSEENIEDTTAKSSEEDYSATDIISLKDKFDEELFEMIKSEDKETLTKTVNVSVALPEINDEYIEQLKRDGLEVRRIIKLIRKVSGSAVLSDIKKIAMHPFVEKITLDKEVFPLED